MLHLGQYYRHLFKGPGQDRLDSMRIHCRLPPSRVDEKSVRFSHRLPPLLATYSRSHNAAIAANRPAHDGRTCFCSVPRRQANDLPRLLVERLVLPQEQSEKRTS